MVLFPLCATALQSLPTSSTPATKEPLIKGKTITGFTSEAEVTMGIMDELKSWNKELVEDLAARLGATCKFKIVALTKSIWLRC